MGKPSNHLINETSPYLLQHAHNPVDWYPWGSTALERAREENKPILISIGYAACHWCHVMERESFEDTATAEIMNEHFINIKIDREERPDLDHIYMDAVQALTGSGGWPLNVFLTPEGKPFYGGTYFPPKRAFNRPSWQEILRGVARSFKENRNDIDRQADNMTEHLIQSNGFGLEGAKETDPIGKITDLPESIRNLMKNADTEWGGFGKAPKFPQTFGIQLLLRFQSAGSHELFQNETALFQQAKNQALLSLDKMIRGGIYDQVGGGFARYSTDVEWLAPHFEKMLYDNALLVIELSEAFQQTGISRYQEVIGETFSFIQRELLFDSGSGQKGFYSALDADSEGEEGKFYVWDYQEVQEILGEDAGLFCEYYDISSWGNWEGKNILRVKVPLEDFSNRKNSSLTEMKNLLEKGRKKLLAERAKRIRPLLDDKILLSWNALMNTACSRAFGATGDETYRQLAIENMHFLLEKFRGESANEFHHTWKNDIAKYPGFLDDYAFLIQALIALQEITGEVQWLENARNICRFVIEHFSEVDSGFFYYTGVGQADLILRKKEVYDGALPSGNSAMAYNLYQLSMFFDEPAWKDRAVRMVSSLGKPILRYPGSFGNWAALWQEMLIGTNEILVLGPGHREILPELLRKYNPHRVILSSETPLEGFPLMSGKADTDKLMFWLCRNFRCLSPVGSVKALITLIDNPDRLN